MNWQAMHLGFPLWISVLTDLQLNVCTCMSLLKLLNTLIACLHEHHHALGRAFCINSGHSRPNNLQLLSASKSITRTFLLTTYTIQSIQISWLSASHSCNMLYLVTQLECCKIYGMDENSSYMQCV
jgi:hypothetical protein